MARIERTDHSERGRKLRWEKLNREPLDKLDDRTKRADIKRPKIDLEKILNGRSGLCPSREKKSKDLSKVEKQEGNGGGLGVCSKTFDTYLAYFSWVGRKREQRQILRKTKGPTIGHSLWKIVEKEKRWGGHLAYRGR